MLSKRVDENNQSFVKQFIFAHGWPNAADWHVNTPKHVWCVIQHGSVDMMELVLPDVKEAFDRGELKGWHYAAMVDRARSHRGKPQVYGTNWQCKSGQEYWSVEDLEDPETVNDRRKSLGLKALEEHSLWQKPCRL